MNWKEILLNPTMIVVATAILTWLARPYFDSYLRKKGENRATHEDIEQINRKLESIRSEFVASNVYTTEKTKNIATKEDIEEITRKVENIKSEITVKIEVLKWELGKKATIHQLAAGKEFESLAMIGEALYELQVATIGLRPFVSYSDPNESEKDKYARRFEEWTKSRDDFMDVVEKHKLFLPEFLHRQFNIIRQVSEKEAISFRSAIKYGGGRLSLEAYEQGQKHTSEMGDAIYAAIKAIRLRYGIEE